MTEDGEEILDRRWSWNPTSAPGQFPASFLSALLPNFCTQVINLSSYKISQMEDDVRAGKSISRFQ